MLSFIPKPLPLLELNFFSYQSSHNEFETFSIANKTKSKIFARESVHRCKVLTPFLLP